MYKVFVGVTNKCVRIVPSSSQLLIHEREFGRLSREEALSVGDGLDEAIRGLLSEKGISDPENYSISYPDDLTNRNERRMTDREKDDQKGPVVETNIPADSKGEPAPLENQKEGGETEPVKPEETKKTVAPKDEKQKDA